MRSPPRVKSSAINASYVHRARKPGGDDRAQAKNAHQHRQVQQHVFQPLYFSRRLL